MMDINHKVGNVEDFHIEILSGIMKTNTGSPTKQLRATISLVVRTIEGIVRMRPLKDLLTKIPNEKTKGYTMIHNIMLIDEETWIQTTRT